MARRETSYPVVLVTDDDGEILAHTMCNTIGAARKVEQESRARDPFGWWANYVIRPLTPSELAYLILG